VLELVRKEFLAGGQNAQYAPILVSHMSQHQEIPKVKYAFLQQPWQIEVLALVEASVIRDRCVMIVQNVVVTIRFRSALYKTSLPINR
jgi:hypothetical protein